ncbi:MAG: carboxypeptidase regulatory-like domain-containing protein, partial [Acidobacteriaceae bacterium]|nr:carboxypeptidase regulatory-like domain-containing protein [Acidobacteriaceae bacterium]
MRQLCYKPIRTGVPAFLLGLLLILSTRQPLKAQSQPVSGTVVDPSGAAVPGATVTITDLNKKQVVKTTTTDGNGRFRELDIEPGRYEVAVERPGFKKATISFDVDVNRQVALGNISLAVGEVNQTVAVNEVAPPIDTDSMDKAYLVDQHQISQLPMNGRNWIALMSIVPGMSSSAQSDFNVNFNDVSQFHGLGGRGSENNFYLDGSPNVDVGDNQSQYTQPSIDSLGEFRVLQSAFNAEYGRAEGVAIAVQTKSGTAQFHGDAYEYLRNDYFDAKCVLCNTLHPTLRYDQFGGNLGGWLYVPKLSTPKDKKIFFFYNREMTRRTLPGSAYADVPNAQILSGNFSSWIVPGSKLPYAPAYPVGTVFEPGTITRDSNGNITGGTPFAGNVVPQSMWNQQSAALLNVYTKLIPGYASLPAAPSAGYARYYFNNPDVLHKDQDLARVDYQVNEKFNTFFRWVNDYQKEQFQTGIWGGEPFPIQPQARPKPGSSWSWNFVNTFTPTLAAETILSYNHQSQSLSVVGNNPVSITAIGATFPQLYPQTNITNSIPNVTTNTGAGYSTSDGGLTTNWNLGNPGWHNWGKDYGITENVTKVLGEHTLKFGAYINWDKKAQTATWPQNASIDFSSSASMPLDTGNGLANLMLGNFNNYSEANAAIYPYFGFQEQDFYAQDSWKVTRRLTVNYGIRFAHIVPTYTIVRGGTPGGEGTFHLYSVDLSKYNPANAPQVNTQTGYLEGNVAQELANEGLICDPCSGIPKGFAPAKNFFQPRLGFAYDLFGDGKTAIRGGFGMFNERLRQNNFNFGAGSNYPNQFSSTALNGNVSSFSLASTGQTPPNMTIFPTDNTMPTIYSWYFGVQRELGKDFTLDVSYSGNHAIHLMDQRQVNALPVGYTAQNPNALPSVNGYYNALLPYLGWGNLNAVETNAYSRYNALMLRATRRFTNGLTGNVNYTYSRTKDIVDNDSDQINNPFNIAAQYAPAGYDQTHVFSTDWVYVFPRLTDKRLLGILANGWELTAILSVHSGMPFSIYSNGNLEGYNVGVQYVDVVGDPYAGQNSAQWIN